MSLSLATLLMVIATIYIRPQEWILLLQRFPLLAGLIFATMALTSYELIRTKERLPTSPHFLALIIFFLFALFSAIPSAGFSFALQNFKGFYQYIIIFFLVAVIVRDPQRLRIFMGSLILILMIVALFGISLRMGRQLCVSVFLPSCEVNADCEPPSVCTSSGCVNLEDSKPCKDHLDCDEISFCEYLGIGNITSIGGRIRYRGVLGDPNDMSLAFVMVLPFILNFFLERRRVAMKILCLASVAIITVAILYSKSRGGMLSMGLVFIIFLMTRFGRGGRVAGIAVTCLALPVMVYIIKGAGRGDEASESAALRIEAWRDGISFVRRNPVWGIGMNRFVDEHGMTAHNSFVLIFGETGYLGYILWLALIYLCLKHSFVLWRAFRKDPSKRITSNWAHAMLCSLLGWCMSAFFISRSYDITLYIILAFNTAFYAVVKRSLPGYKLRFGLKDLAFLASLALISIVGIWVLTMVSGY